MGRGTVIRNEFRINKYKQKKRSINEKRNRKLLRKEGNTKLSYRK